jgi:hypothetical protein
VEVRWLVYGEQNTGKEWVTLSQAWGREQNAMATMLVNEGKLVGNEKAKLPTLLGRVYDHNWGMWQDQTEI